MAILIFGTKETLIGVDEFLIKCPSCETHSWADVMVVSKYFHLFYIPFLPIEKEANVICNKCGLKRFGMSFNANLITNFEEIKGKFRHPSFTYSGCALIILSILTVIFIKIFSHP